MIQISIRLNSSTILAVFGMLVLFGILYNLLVGWLERKGYHEGYVAFLVAFGVLITLCGVSLISWQASMLVLIGFIASGLPMILGSVYRHVRRREKDLLSAIHDITQGMAE
jgi:cyanate permease